MLHTVLLLCLISSLEAEPLLHESQRKAIELTDNRRSFVVLARNSTYTFDNVGDLLYAWHRREVRIETFSGAVDVYEMPTVGPGKAKCGTKDNDKPVCRSEGPCELLRSPFTDFCVRLAPSQGQASVTLTNELVLDCYKWATLVVGLVLFVASSWISEHEWARAFVSALVTAQATFWTLRNGFPHLQSMEVEVLCVLAQLLIFGFVLREGVAPQGGPGFHLFLLLFGLGCIWQSTEVIEVSMTIMILLVVLYFQWWVANWVHVPATARSVSNMVPYEKYASTDETEKHLEELRKVISQRKDHWLAKVENSEELAHFMQTGEHKTPVVPHS